MPQPTSSATQGAAPQVGWRQYVSASASFARRGGCVLGWTYKAVFRRHAWRLIQLGFNFVLGKTTLAQNLTCYVGDSRPALNGGSARLLRSGGIVTTHGFFGSANAQTSIRFPRAPAACMSLDAQTAHNARFQHWVGF